LVVAQRESVGLHAIIAIHSTRRGPAFGGIRRLKYASESAGLDDALELAEAMSFKCALAGLAAGGAKTVVFDSNEPPPYGWSAAYAALGEAIEELGGAYVCGPDLGTGVAELAAVRRGCAHVNPEGNDAGVSTAAGVHAGVRAIWRRQDLVRDRPRRVAVQGLGSVGLALAVALRDEGVEVIGADLDASACTRAAALGVTIVPPAELSRTPCDVLSPCAQGHVFDAAVIEELRCRAICGSANNQLSTPSDARRLHARGIVHAPDLVVSAGAVIEGVLTTQEGNSAAVRRRIGEAIAGIEGSLHELLTEAARLDRPPIEVARSLARARIEAA